MASRPGTRMVLTGASWENTEVPCTFALTADGVRLPGIDPDRRVFDLPANTDAVEITATPTTKLFWPTTINLVMGPDGGFVLQPGPGTAAVAALFGTAGTTSGLVMVVLKISRFRDVTTKVFDLLQTVPIPRGANAPPKRELERTYGSWPPPDLDVHPALDAHILDVNTPVNAGGIMNFAKEPSLTVDVDSVVLELAGVAAPRLLGVTWPKAIAPTGVAAPTPILMFVRQTGGQDAIHGVFTGGAVAAQPYPFNFDYAERCLFESQHYGPTPLFKAIGWTLRPKGVPYQVAASGAKVVTVFPVAHAKDSIGYGVLADMDQAGEILEELQAFMFWRAGVSLPPTSLGHTAIAAYSSANYVLTDWLKREGNRSSSFLQNTVRALYYLDPPDINDSIKWALTWAGANGDKRIRLYTRDSSPSHAKLLGSKPPNAPYVKNSPDGMRTAAALPTSAWIRTFKDVLGSKVDLAWWDAHHFIPATVLTHAVQQGDLGS